MRLIPPDCSQEEAVVQLGYSLSAFQLTVDQIFRKAALRTEKCRQRVEQLGKRMETLERKMEAVEELQDVPVLNCASNYPELGTPGLYEPVFDRLGLYAPFICRHSSENGPKQSDSNSLSEAIGRRKNLSPHFFGKDGQRTEKVILNVSKIEKLSAVGNSSGSEVHFDQFLTRLTCGRRAEKTTPTESAAKSAQIDFSESLIDLCPPITVGQRPMAFALGMDHQEDDDPFAYEPAELGELADFDLPEDLPGIDVKSVVSFVSKPSTENFLPSAEMDNDRLRDGREDISSEATKLAQLTLKDVEQTDVPLPTAVFKESAKPSKTADNFEVSKQSHASPPPPPPPPPPSLQQQKIVSDVPSSLSVSSRSDLMAAIRATGGMKGAKLKKVEKVGEGGDNAGKAEGAKADRGESEDLMSSLAKALEKRRKGMFGKGTATSGAVKPKKPSGGGGGTLSVLRERVPRIRAESGEDDEEEDDEEARSEWVD